MYTYTIEVSYDDGRCYVADTDSHADAEKVLAVLADRPDVVAYAVRIAEKGKAFLSQVFVAGRCTSAECMV